MAQGEHHWGLCAPLRPLAEVCQQPALLLLKELDVGWLHAAVHNVPAGTSRSLVVHMHPS